MSEEQTLLILEDLAVGFDLDKRITFSAICLLFGKGAANAGTPNSLAVQVVGTTYKGSENRLTIISKKDLVYYYEKRCENTLIRRFAESNAELISKRLQMLGAGGDLRKKIDNTLSSRGEEPLSREERAWASTKLLSQLRWDNNLSFAYLSFAEIQKEISFVRGASSYCQDIDIPFSPRLKILLAEDLINRNKGFGTQKKQQNKKKN